MKLDDIVGLLSSVPLFSGLSDKQLTSIALNGEPVVFSDGQEIICENEVGNAAFLILSGDVRRTAGPYAAGDLSVFGPGTFVGEMAMLVESTYSSSVAAQGRVRAIKFDRAVLRVLMEEDVSVAQHFSDKITGRFVNFVGALKGFRDRLDVLPGDVEAQGGMSGGGSSGGEFHPM